MTTSPAPASAANSEAVALDNWHEDDGPKLWWFFPIQEPPYVGTPNDNDWPGYHTHYTAIPIPELDPALQPHPSQQAGTEGQKSGHEPVVTLSSRFVESSASGVRVDEDPQPETVAGLISRLRLVGPGDQITLGGWSVHLILADLNTSEARG